MSTGCTARVQLHAIAGLASTHSAPFVRLLHDDVIVRRYRGRTESPRQTIVAVELPDDQALPTTRQRSHHKRSEYTAAWEDPHQPSCTTTCLPMEVDWIEVQVWNRFADVAVFLGVTKISLQASRRLAVEGKLRGPAITMWYPLDRSSDLSNVARNGTHQALSIQLSLSWHPYDERTTRIQREITERREGKRHQGGGDEGANEEPSASIVVDPSFRFIEPSTSIEWSSVVAANVRRIFLQGDLSQLQLFYEDVLHGDMDQEIEDDDDIVVDDAHLTAFRVCQLSAQYLDHCVALLDERKDEYTDLHRALSATRRDQRRDNKQLAAQKRRLQKELGELDLLAATYEKLLEHHGMPAPSVERTYAELPAAAAPRPVSNTAVPVSPSRAIADEVVSKKPAFLMTWEERERARKQQKDLDKAKRIDDEKARLQSLFQARQDRESLELGLSTLTQRRRDRSARVVQAAARAFLIRRRLRQANVSILAAWKIQSHVRRWICRCKWPQTRAGLEQARERRWMSQCDVESTEMRRREQVQQQHLNLSPCHIDILCSDKESSIGSPSAKHVKPLALVVMWKKLKRILTLACEKGANHTVVFETLDRRCDGVLDRHEFRLGVRHFGIRMDRPMTRAIISLARAKCEESPRPLTLTIAQFIQGFELPTIEVSPVVPPTAGDAKEPTGALEASDESSSPEILVRPPARVRRSHGSEYDDEVDDPADRETSQTIEAVAEAVATLRRRVLSAAQAHLAAKHQSVTDYVAFREALTHVFQEFDVDGNGELDLHELVECMAAIEFKVTPENLAIVKECFVEDATSQSVSISEFISFALAGMRSSSSKRPVDEELGILGYRLRDAILGRVKIARKQTDSIEDAVRLVFKGAYRTKTHGSCPRRTFARVLASLRLGFTPAQLSRLVLRLDQDGDHTISFHEVLTWLRLGGSTSRVPSPERPLDRSETSYSIGWDTVSFIRAVYMELAGLSGVATTGSQRRRADSVGSLFRRIDRNGSTKIHASELEEFLSGVELAELRIVRQWEDTRGVAIMDAAQLAQETIKLIDLNGNGVVALDEWMGFMLEENGANPGHSERYAIVEAVRAAMRTAFPDELALLEWFRSIPGAIPSDKTLSTEERKLRTREFKNAMRAKLSGAESTHLDHAIKILDADGSGWVTEKELCAWQFPTRDIEELRALVTRMWSAERDVAKHRELTDDAFEEVLYGRFDQDGNGLIARKEAREGFRSFRIMLNEDESVLLIKEFDLDRDGFWSRAEFKAAVKQLLPHTSPVSRFAVEDQQRFEQYSSDSQQQSDGEYESPDSDHAEKDGIQRRDEEEVYSFGALSRPAMSPIQFDEASVAASRQQRMMGVEYSEDFDDDA